MDESAERRREKRLRYNWPIWFAEDFNEHLSQGQMVDVSSGGAAFTCYSDQCPTAGDHVTARFSVPRYGEEDSFDLENFIRSGHICRVDEIGPFVKRVAIQFLESLPFKPGEGDEMEDAVEDAFAQTDEFELSEGMVMAEGAAL